MPPVLVLHLEAESHPALVAAAVAALGIKQVEVVATERIEAPAAPAALTPPPSAPVELPTPAPRAPRQRRAAAPNLPAAAPAAALPEAPAAAATAPAPQVPAPAVAAPAASASSSTVTGSASPAPTGAAAPVVPTIDEVRYVLGEVNGAYGMAVCTSLLEQYGAQRVSLVPEAKRADFIKECQAKVAKHKADQAAAAAAKPA